MDEIDRRSSILPAKQRDTAAFSAQVDGNSCSFRHWHSINSVRIQRQNDSSIPAQKGIKWLAVQPRVPEPILNENTAPGEWGAKAAGDDGEASEVEPVWPPLFLKYRGPLNTARKSSETNYAGGHSFDSKGIRSITGSKFIPVGFCSTGRSPMVLVTSHLT
jgi:hypothetical protein